MLRISVQPSSWLREAWRAAVNSVCSPRALLFFMIAMNASLLAPNLSLVAHEFGFSPDERDDLLGGRLPLVFFAAVRVITCTSYSD